MANRKVMAERNFESLRVWQNARIFVNAVYDMMADNKDWGFRDQIQRASVSIMNVFVKLDAQNQTCLSYAMARKRLIYQNNIAEGYESGSDAKYVNFLNIAKGSCSEVRNMLYLCKDRHFCTEEQFNDLKSQAIQISSQLYKLIEYLNNGKKTIGK